MKSLGKFLNAKYKKESRENFTKIVDERTVFFLAKKIIEEEYGKRGISSVKPRYFSSGKLFLSGKNSLWVDEMNSFRGELLSRLNETVGMECVKEIKISHEYGE